MRSTLAWCGVLPCRTIWAAMQAATCTAWAAHTQPHQPSHLPELLGDEGHVGVRQPQQPVKHVHQHAARRRRRRLVAAVHARLGRLDVPLGGQARAGVRRARIRASSPCGVLMTQGIALSCVPALHPGPSGRAGPAWPTQAAQRPAPHQSANSPQMNAYSACPASEKSSPSWHAVTRSTRLCVDDTTQRSVTGSAASASGVEKSADASERHEASSSCDAFRRQVRLSGRVRMRLQEACLAVRGGSDRRTCGAV